MRLPRAEDAVVDIDKLREYCLNPDHRVGANKARVFRSALGLTAADAEVLRDELLSAAREKDALAFGDRRFGDQYRIDFDLTYAGRSAKLRSLWIVRRGEDFPRLTSCYVR